MDPSTIATTAVNFLVPYLARVGEAVANKAIDQAWEKIKTIYSAVKDKLAGDAYAEQTLRRLEEAPDSQSRRTALVSVLEEKIQEDPTFAKSLQKLLGEAKNAGAETIVQQVSVSGQAHTGDITTIGKVEGDIDFGERH